MKLNLDFLKFNKGKEVKKTIAQLQNKTNIPIKVLDKTIKSKKFGWTITHNYTFDSDIIQLIKIRPHNDYPTSSVLFFDPNTNQEQQLTLANDQMFSLLKDAVEIKKLQVKYDKYMFKNMIKQLRYSGGFSSKFDMFLEKANKLSQSSDFIKKKLEFVDENSGNININSNGFPTEFSYAPTHCMGWHGDHIHTSLKIFSQEHGVNFIAKTVIDIPENMITEVPIKAQSVINVYQMKPKKNISEVSFRAAEGGVHLHFSHKLGNGENKKSKEEMDQIVKALDAILGVACVSMFAKQDEARRREVTGIAGDYKIHTWGLEYKVLSNAWLFHPLIANIVCDLARTVSAFGEKGFLKHWKSTEKETIQCINTHDVALARKILKRNQKMLKELLLVRLSYDYHVELAFNTIMKGMEHSIKDPTDIKTNWNVNTATRWVTHCDGEGKNIARSFMYNNLTAKHEQRKAKF